jgi:glycosyltransferase involved in cell wall biosynthesis
MLDTAACVLRSVPGLDRPRLEKQNKHKSLRIAQVAPPFESVPPAGYGGTERVVSVLTEELVRRGHDVTLFAPGDSRTSAHLVPIVERALWHQPMRYRDFTPFWSMVLGRLVQDMHEFDVIHSHLDYFRRDGSRVREGLRRTSHVIR